MANKVYINPETSKTFTDTGGDETLDMGGLAANAGRVSERLDLGSAARCEWYEWRLVIDGFATTPVIGQTVDLYFSQSDGTNHDGDVGDRSSSDALLGSVNDLPNMLYAGSAYVQSSIAADELVCSGVVRLTSRYVHAVVHNNTQDALASSGDSHKVILTPIPPEIQ